MTTIDFLGAAGTVTGSKYLVDTGKVRFMVDCGMFQGAKKLRLMNWAGCPVSPKSIDHILLTHAHIDHIGMLPVYVRQGFASKVWTTPATAELCEISLLDAAHLQEEDARFANKKGFSKHKPALPLYTVEDAQQAIRHLSAVDYESDLRLNDDVTVRFRDAGHILGSATVEAGIGGNGKPMKILFSGDLGRYNSLILRDPEPVESADYLVVESTYGDRKHPVEETEQEIADVVNSTARKGGILVIPAFALGRTQTLLYVLRELKNKQAIPDLPIYVDSPMAINVTEVFCRHVPDFDDEARAAFRATGTCPVLCPNLRFVRNPKESQELNSVRFPSIIISASGMATGGRILHHLKYRLPEPRNTILFVGYQSAGTRGQLIKDGARTIRIHGEDIPVRARIEMMESFSGHADSTEILRWLGNFRQPPRTTFVVHGEPESSAALAAAIQKSLGWKTHIPELGERVTLK
jgi:metallo-beta-lactamase family protein